MSNPWENPNQEPGENNEPHRMPQGMPTGPVTPPMGRRKGTWYAWTPLLIKFLISIAVSMIAVMGYTFVYISQHYEETVGAMQSQQDMLELSVSISERMLQYTTQLEGITALIVIPVILYMFHRDRKNEKMAGVIPNRKAPLWKYGAVIGIAAALCVGLNNLILISNISSYSAAYQQTSDSLYSAPFVMQLLCLGILVPISEELVFRGMMFKRMREQSGFGQAAFLSSLVFAILHGNMVQMLYAFATGMILCYVYEKYGSVKAPAVGHIVMNIISVAASRFGFFGWMMENNMRISVITILCGAFAAVMFVLIQRIDERPILPGGPEEKNTAVV